MVCGCLVWLLAGGSLPAQDLPRFREQVISKAVKFGYQLVAVDLNGDGKKDLIAVDEQATEVDWFENPTWERHVLATDVPRPLNAACYDIDGDGIPEVILAYRFESRPEQSVGNVVLLTHGKDVRQPWTAREIDRVPTAHRVRWIDPEGNGKKVLLLGRRLDSDSRPSRAIRCPSISIGPANGNGKRSPPSRAVCCTRSIP
jgi:hypothetical protein